jgi:hypothetical protein
MKATITYPARTTNSKFAICLKINFPNIEVSISLDNGATDKGAGEWTHRDDVRVYKKDTGEDLTLKVLGSESNHASDGYELTEILLKAKAFDEEIEANN